MNTRTSVSFLVRPPVIYVPMPSSECPAILGESNILLSLQRLVGHRPLMEATRYCGARCSLYTSVL